MIFLVHQRILFEIRSDIIRWQLRKICLTPRQKLIRVARLGNLSQDLGNFLGSWDFSWELFFRKKPWDKSWEL